METSSLTIKQYLDLLKQSYESIQIAEDRQVIIFTRSLYLTGILICWVLAYNLPDYREMFSVGILFLGFFLLSAIIRTNLKKRQQNKARKPYDRMIYQLSDVSKMALDLKADGLDIEITRKDKSTRILAYPTKELSAYQKLGKAFLISNQEGIDFIIPEGIFKVTNYLSFMQGVEDRFKK